MTGIAVAETNNNNGIAGISGGWSTNEGCNYMPVRISYSATDESLSAAGIEYAGENGAKVISFSYGWARDVGEPTILRDKIDDVVDSDDIVFVAPAGNDDEENRRH